MELKRKAFENLVFLLFILIFTRCGVKGTPSPPQSIYPHKVEDLKAFVRAGCTELSWSYSWEPAPEKFLIFRMEEKDLSEKYLVGDVSGKANRFRDCQINAGHKYAYQIIGISHIGTQGEPSKIIWINFSKEPSPPKNLQVKAGDEFIDLSWQAEQGLFYNIYRSLNGKEFPSKPVNIKPIKAGFYSDIGLKNGQRYYYCVRSVIIKEGFGAVESRCAFASAVPIDLVAPLAPRGLIAVLRKNGVELKWMSSQEPDLAGYIIYRRRCGEKIWNRLIKNPIKENHYLDVGAKRLSGCVEYAVSAIDNAPSKNESPLSVPQKVIIP